MVAREILFEVLSRIRDIEQGFNSVIHLLLEQESGSRIVQLQSVSNRLHDRTTRISIVENS